MTISRRECLFEMLGLAAVTSLSGCGASPKKVITLETVSSVLVSQDHKQLVVITQDHHYVFELPAAAFAALQADFHPYVGAMFSDFHVSSSGQVRGQVTLTVDKAQSEAVASAVAAGFKGNSNGAFFKTTLHGACYKAGGVQPMPAYRLNMTYVIPVEGQGDAGTTPISIVGGVILLSAVALIILFHPRWPN